jgi:hypothetical protein
MEPAHIRLSASHAQDNKKMLLNGFLFFKSAHLILLHTVYYTTAGKESASLFLDFGHLLSERKRRLLFAWKKIPV